MRWQQADTAHAQPTQSRKMLRYAIGWKVSKQLLLELRVQNQGEKAFRAYSPQ